MMEFHPRPAVSYLAVADDMESTPVFGRTPDVSGDSRRAYSSNEN